MKKIVVMLLTVLCLLSLSACGKKEKLELEDHEFEPIKIGSDIEESDVAGGFGINKDIDNLCTSEQTELFNKAMEGMTGVGYTPIVELGSQVVAGKNHMYLAKGTTVTATPKTNLYCVVIYEDLQGNLEVQKINQLDMTMFTEENDVSNEQLLGGWHTDDLVPNIAIDSDAAAAVDEALEGLTGVTYNKLALLGRQVVAGTNYLVLTKAFVASPDAQPYFAVLKVYKPLDGKAELSSVYTINLPDLIGIIGK